jgi:hypothetical protein
MRQSPEASNSGTAAEETTAVDEKLTSGLSIAIVLVIEFNSWPDDRSG